MKDDKGVEGLSTEPGERRASARGQFVIFHYCISVLILTFKRPSPIFFIRAGESPHGKHIGYTLLSLVAGWWGIPWGPIFTIGSVFTNLSGGKDVTQSVMASVNPASA